MGISSWLFGKKSAAKLGSFTRQDERQTSHSGPFDDFLELPTRNFFGPCSRSPNKYFTLAWRDGDDSGSHGGSRSSGLGLYILLQGEKIVTEGRMARPNDGKVANNGVFIINDWEFSSDLRGVFSSFRPDGKNILSRRYKANLYNNGLSADGRLAVCQTCNSPDSNDSSILTVFDLSSGKEIASWPPESGWASSYEFPPDGQTIILVYPDGGHFSYTLDGKFFDRVKWANIELDKGNLIVVERFLKAAESDLSSALIEKLNHSIDVALTSAQPDDHRMQAWALKLRGVCLEAQNDQVRALSCYEGALALNPKIGLKRRAEQLRKALAN